MRGKFVRLAVTIEGGLLVLAWILGWLLSAPPFKQAHLTWQAVFLGVLATFPALLGMWWCASLPFAPFRRLRQEVEEKLVPLVAQCSHLEIALISLLAGVGEEAFFRGAIQTALADGGGPWGALLVTSALFGLAHLITPTYAVLAGLLGLYLGGLSIFYENLLAVIVVHALYDYVALIYLIKGKSKKARGGE